MKLAFLGKVNIFSDNKYNLLQIISAIILAILYCINPIYPWIKENTPLSRPFITSVGILILIVIPIFWRSISPTIIWRELKFPDLMVAGFILLALLKLPPENMLTHRFAGMILSSGIIYIMARLIGSIKPHIFLWTLIMLSIISALISIPQIIAAEHVQLQERIWIFVNIIVTQWPAVTLGASILILFSLLLNTKNRYLILLTLILLLLSYFFIIYVVARAVVVAVFVAAMIITLINNNIKSYIFLILLFVAFFFFYNSLPEGKRLFFNQLSTFNDSNIDISINLYNVCTVVGNSIQIRSIMYSDAIAAFLTNPLGVGTGEFSKYTCVYGFGAVNGDPHSEILHIAAELGIIGLLFFFGIIGWIFIRGILSSRLENRRLIVISLLGVWIFQLVYDQFQISYFAAIPFFMLSGILVSVLREPK